MARAVDERRWKSAARLVKISFIITGAAACLRAAVLVLENGLRTVRVAARAVRKPAGDHHPDCQQFGLFTRSY